MFKKYPSIIFEVLSESTALYDAQLKLNYYKKIESLNYYVLVSQKEVKVQMYSRIDNSQVWKYQTYETQDEVILFDRLGFELPVSTIYDGIGFDASPA
ncbi:MAG: Uma2 family endonuclease [Bacteroidota bacterium]